MRKSAERAAVYARTLRAKRRKRSRTREREASGKRLGAMSAPPRRATRTKVAP